MLIRASKWTAQRMESLGGAVMVDTYRGEIRIRKWPEPRGAKQTPQQAETVKRFTEAQRAAKYLAPDLARLLLEWTEGTPILPRDVLTAMMFNQFAIFELPDGKVLYPMAARDAVSESLDAITQTEGDTLVRTPQGWRGTAAGGGSSTILLLDQTITAPVPVVNFSVPPNAKRVNLQWDDLQVASNRAPAIRASTDGGATFHAGSTDYQYADSGNIVFNTGALIIASGGTVNLHSGRACLDNFDGQIPLSCNVPQRQWTAWFAANELPITDLQFWTYLGDMTAGRLRATATT